MWGFDPLLLGSAVKCYSLRGVSGHDAEAFGDVKRLQMMISSDWEQDTSKIVKTSILHNFRLS